MLLPLELVKKHLSIDFDDDDEIIAAYQLAAETIITEYLGGLPEGDRPPTITTAVLLLVGDLYEHREADPKIGGDAVLPRAVRALLAPLRRW